MKQCARCKDSKELILFAKNSKSKDGHAPWCKACFAAYDRERYHTLDKDRKMRNAKKRQEANRDFVWSYLESHHCVDCGQSDPVVLDFDHRDEKSKVKDIATLIFEAGIDRLKLEISKCDVRCANCHRRRTAQQFGSWRLLRNLG